MKNYISQELVYNRISNAKNNLINSKDYKSIPELIEADASQGRPQIGQILKLIN
jgi:hypothetical protein